MDDYSLILQLLKEGRDNDTKIIDEIGKIKENIVGEENCAQYRKCVSEEVGKLDSRLKLIEDKINHPIELNWQRVKDNHVYLTSFIGGCLVFVGVLSGRGYDLVQMVGLHAFLIGLCVFLVGGVSAWITRSKAKKVLQKIGVINVIIVFLLLSCTLAQDDEDISVVDTRPLSLPMLAEASNKIAVDVFGQQSCIDLKNSDFIGNNTTNGLVFIPANLTIA